ncbi:MAG: trypsin-like peptidase domain-containing protein [Pirellulaceae bacterium]
MRRSKFGRILKSSALQCAAPERSAQQRSAQQRGLLAASLLVALLLTVATADTVRAEVDPAVLAAQKQRIEAIAKAQKAAVSVFAAGGRGGGSGVVITPDGYALTNFHVVKPAGSIMHCSMPDDQLYEAVIVGIDPVGDVAMIKLLGRDDFPCAELADSDEVKVGDYCFAVGNPFLLATDFQPTVTWGIVSGVNRYQYPAGTLLEYADCIQTDAAINPGNSGGPLFDAQGRLIGINGRGSFEKRGRVNVGVGYAISINQIKNFMGYLRSGRIVDHATLGANVTTDEDGHVVVSNILESSDAYRRGLRYGDEVVSFGNRPITTVNGFKNALGIFPKGWRVPLSFRRDGEQYDVYVRLAGVHRDEELIDKIQQPQPGDPQPEPKKDEKQPDGEKKDGQNKDEDADKTAAEDEDGDKDDEQGDPEKVEGDKPKPRKLQPGQPRPGQPRPGQPRPGQPKPGQPRPMPANPHAAQQSFSKEAQAQCKARRGYANYYFNELNRDRVWKAFTDRGDFSGLADPWRLEGTVAGAPIEITLSAQSVSGTFPGGPAELDPTKDLDVQLDPPASGGLLAALHLWHRLLTIGPKTYGDLYYQGTVPLPGRDGRFDSLHGTYNVIESRFLFDPATGELASVEFYPVDHNDPCEVRMSDYREVDGRMAPHRLEVRHGDNLYGTIELKKISFTSEAE